MKQTPVYRLDIVVVRSCRHHRRAGAAIRSTATTRTAARLGLRWRASADTLFPSHANQPREREAADGCLDIQEHRGAGRNADAAHRRRRCALRVRADPQGLCGQRRDREATVDVRLRHSGNGPNRGVMYWASGNDRRIFAAWQLVYALDAATGKPIATFGTGGRIDLRENLGRDPQLQTVRLTTPVSSTRT